MDPRMMLAQSLMGQRPIVGGGTAGAIANFGAPIAGALLMRNQQQRQEKKRQAETSALGRLLSTAEKARATGGDPMAAMTAELEANRGKPGYEEAGRALLERRLSGVLAPAPERKILEDVTGRKRYADTGAAVFPDVTAPKEPPKTRKFQRGDEVVTQEWDPERGEYVEIATGPKRAGVEVKMPRNITEVEATTNAILENRQKYEETGDPKYAQIADRLEMKQAFGGKPPESYVKARNSMQQAREGIAETYDLISRGRANPLNPKDRAKVAQSLNKARLAYADMLNRGANFTESEQAMIDALLGGDPNDILQRTLRGDTSYMESLQAAGEALERRGQGLLKSYTQPGVGEFTYPWQQGAPVVGAAPAVPAVPGAGPPAPPMAATAAPPKVPESVPNADLLNADLDNMTPEQRAEWEAQMRERGLM